MVIVTEVWELLIKRRMNTGKVIEDPSPIWRVILKGTRPRLVDSTIALLWNTMANAEPCTLFFFGSIGMGEIVPKRLPGGHLGRHINK
jgi:hypothetical protein